MRPLDDIDTGSSGSTNPAPAPAPAPIPTRTVQEVNTVRTKKGKRSIHIDHADRVIHHHHSAAPTTAPTTSTSDHHSHPMSAPLQALVWALVIFVILAGGLKLAHKLKEWFWNDKAPTTVVTPLVTTPPVPSPAAAATTTPVVPPPAVVTPPVTPTPATTMPAKAPTTATSAPATTSIAKTSVVATMQALTTVAVPDGSGKTNFYSIVNVVRPMPSAQPYSGSGPTTTRSADPATAPSTLPSPRPTTSTNPSTTTSSTNKVKRIEVCFPGYDGTIFVMTLHDYNAGNGRKEQMTVIGKVYYEWTEEDERKNPNVDPIDHKQVGGIDFIGLPRFSDHPFYVETRDKSGKPVTEKVIDYIAPCKHPW